MYSETVTERAYKFLGFNDDCCTCDICGKEDLRGTYALESFTTGDIVRAGSVCGAKMLGFTIAEFVSTHKKEFKLLFMKAKNELINSSEYKAYNNEIDRLNNLNIYNYRERMETLNPLELMKTNVSQSIIKKYSLPLNTYLG